MPTNLLACSLAALCLGAPTTLAQNAIQADPQNDIRFDLGLEEAFARADQNNPSLSAARRGLDLSRADITIAGASPNPQFNIQYGFGSIYTDQGNPQQLAINQPVELGGKREARLALADSQYQLTAIQLASLRWEIRARVRRAYAELAAAQAQARAIDQQIALIQKLVDIARKRFEAGAAPQAEVLQAELSRSQFDTQRTQALGRIAQARIQLNFLLGVAPQREIDVRDKSLFELSIERTELVPRPDAVLPTVDTLVNRAFEQRLDLQAVQQQTGVARRQLNLAQTQRIPDLQLSGGYLFTSFTNGISQANGFFAGIGITAPVFYNFQGEVARAQATIDQSGLQTSALRAQIDAEVRTAYQALSVARDNIRKYQSQLLPASQDVLNLAQESYQVGKTGLASAILSQQANQQIRSGYLDAVVSYQTAWADLERAVGSPLVL